MEFLHYTREQLNEYCKSLSDEEKVDTYRWVLDQAKNVIESTDVAKLKRLSDVAVAIEETTDKELLKSFDDNNPLREAYIAVMQGNEEDSEYTNYLFSIGSSSKLYDLRKNEKEALYQAIKSDDVELVKHLLIVLLPADSKDANHLDLQKIKELLSKSYEELESSISDDMKNYLEKKIRFYSFLCDFKFDKDPIELFANQSEANYEVDKFLLSLIMEKTKEEGLLSEIDSMIKLLEKYERFDELEYKVRRLKSELESGKSKYPIDIIQASIEERESEMREIKEKYIKTNDLMIERRKLLEQLKKI